jgi:hypothetical protein
MPSTSTSTARPRARHRAEHAALHRDHLDRGQVVAVVGGARAVLEQQALVAAVVALAHRGVDADVGGDPGEDEVLDAARPQDQLEVRRAERALARLVDHALAGLGRELGDDLPPGLAAHEDPPARSGIADPGADATRPPALVGGKVGQIRAMALARVDHVEAAGARRRQRRPNGLDRRARQREIVAHAIDVAPDAAEVGLHVDDDQRRVLRTQIAVIRPRIRLRFHVPLTRPRRLSHASSVLSKNTA